MKKDPVKKLSIIIPVFNEGEHIKNTVHQVIQASDGIQLELIVVDDNSSDGCCEFLNEYKSVFHNISITTLQTDGIGNTKARARGASVATGQILLFIDAHMEIAPNFLWQLLTRYHSHPQINILAPSVYDSTENNRKLSEHFLYSCADTFWVQPCWIKAPPEYHNCIVQVPFVCACAFSLREGTYRRLNGLPEFPKGWFDEGLYFSTVANLAGENVYQDCSLSIGHRFKHITQCNDAELARRRFALSNGLCASYVLYDTGVQFERAVRSMQANAGELFTSALREFQSVKSQLKRIRTRVQSRSIKSFAAFSKEFEALLPALSEVQKTTPKQVKNEESIY
jgi:glycosyltransferase involved in cell wall biosynthesis